MPERQKSIRVDTIGDVLASPRLCLYAHCRRCLHAHRLDLAMIAAVHGPGLRLVQLRGRLRCQHCGARQADLHQVYDPGSPLPEHPDKDRLKAKR